MNERPLFAGAPGNTPLTEEERHGLLLPVLTRGELDAAEADTISQARLRLLAPGRRLTIERILDVGWMQQLHRDMYGDVWSWAGAFRTTERNLGVEPWKIPMALRDLTEDAMFWLADLRDNAPTGMPADELCLRLSHRAVLIHPFPNGNGRWSRLLADAAAVSLRRAVFTWGRTSFRGEDANLRRGDAVRQAYLGTLRAADHQLDYAPLMAFARS